LKVWGLASNEEKPNEPEIEVIDVVDDDNISNDDNFSNDDNVGIVDDQMEVERESEQQLADEIEINNPSTR
jgi:hypothetical protein